MICSNSSFFHVSFNFSFLFKFYVLCYKQARERENVAEIPLCHSFVIAYIYQTHPRAYIECVCVSVISFSKKLKNLLLSLISHFSFAFAFVRSFVRFLLLLNILTSTTTLNRKRELVVVGETAWLKI